MSWISPASPPPFTDGDEWPWKYSEPVLVCVDGKRLVATYELHEDSAPDWFTDDSERWRITGRVQCWQPLPPLPDSIPV